MTKSKNTNTIIITSIAGIVGLIATYYTARSNKYNIELTKLQIESERLKLEVEKARLQNQIKQGEIIEKNYNQVLIPKY